MTNKNVGNGLDRSVKKILSLVLSLAMLCTMMTAFGITASAAGAIEILDFTTLKDTIESATEPIEIDITKDITGGTYINVNDGKNITINLNGHTVECDFVSNEGTLSTLTIHGGFGTIKGTGSGKGSCIYLYNGSTLIADNVKIIGKDATGSRIFGQSGIYLQDAIAKLDNCYVKAGNSTTNWANPASISAINGGDEGRDNKIYVKNSTFIKGTGGKDDSCGNIESGTLYDLDENLITDITERNQSPLIIGTGYDLIISDSNGTPARGNSPVSATTSIPAPTYTVTIPSTVNFGDQKQALEKYRNEDSDQFGKAVVVSKPFTVSATGVKNLFNDLDDGKDDYINVTAEFDGTLKGTNKAENTVPYIIKQGENELATGEKIATFYNDVDLASKGATNSATATIYMNRADIKNADSYQGTMTFTIAVADRANG